MKKPFKKLYGIILLFSLTSIVHYGVNLHYNSNSWKDLILLLISCWNVVWTFNLLIE